jgi:hypothetical protein
MLAPRFPGPIRRFKTLPAGLGRATNCLEGVWPRPRNISNYPCLACRPGTVGSWSLPRRGSWSLLLEEVGQEVVSLPHYPLYIQIGPALGVRRPAVCPAEPAAWRRPYRTTATERNKVRATLRGSPALAAAVLVTSLAAGRSCTLGPAPPGGGRRRRSRRRGRPRSAGSAGRPRAGAVRCWIPAAAARCRATAALPECWPTPACNLSSWAPTGRRSC